MSLVIQEITDKLGVITLCYAFPQRYSRVGHSPLYINLTLAIMLNILLGAAVLRLNFGCKIYVPIVLLEYIVSCNLFGCKANIWEGLPDIYLLLFSVSIVILLLTKWYLLLLCQHFACCFCIPITPIILLVKSISSYLYHADHIRLWITLDCG